jgi:magnesium transporter
MVETTERPAEDVRRARENRRGQEPGVTVFRRDDAERLERLADAPRKLSDSELLWIDAEAVTEETARSIADHLGVDGEVVDSLVNHAERATFRDGGSFVHVTALAPDEEHDGLSPVECLVGDNWIVTAHDRRVRVLDDFADLASGSGPTGKLRGADFLAALLEWVLNEYAMAFERIEQELERIDERSMRGKSDPEAEIEHLVGLRRRTGRLRRALSAHRLPLLALMQPELEALGDSGPAERFEAVYARYEATLQTARDARESIVSSFDVLIARTGHRTNEIVKVLTLVSVMFLPGALVAGVMGMNFKVSLFAHPVGFWVVLGAVVAIAVVTLSIAKLRDWI